MSQTTPQDNQIAELMIRDAAGDYRSATSEEVLKAAHRVLARRVRHAGRSRPSLPNGIRVLALRVDWHG